MPDVWCGRELCVIINVISAATATRSWPVISLSAAPKGFVVVQDQQDNYQFLYPFGWQEVAVKGADVVFKDVVEPLESVSVTLTSTDKKDIVEFGDITDVSCAHHNHAWRPTAHARG